MSVVLNIVALLFPNSLRTLQQEVSKIETSFKLVLHEFELNNKLTTSTGPCITGSRFNKNASVTYMTRFAKSFSKFGTYWQQCCGSGMFIPDPGSEFFDPGSRVKKIPDPHPHQFIKEFKYF